MRNKPTFIKQFFVLVTSSAFAESLLESGCFKPVRRHMRTGSQNFPRADTCFCSTFDFHSLLASLARKPVTLYCTVVDKILIRIVGLWFRVSHDHSMGEIHHALNLERVFISVFKEGNLQCCSCTSRYDQAAAKASSGDWMLRTLTKRIQ